MLAEATRRTNAHLIVAVAGRVVLDAVVEVPLVRLPVALQEDERVAFHRPAWKSGNNTHHICE